jgi:hypothetical protein
METSNEVGKIARALKAFQKDMKPIARDAKANYGRYASLGNILKEIKEPLVDNGLSFTQMVEGDNLTTMIMHESGEWLRATGALKLDKQTAQGQGSAITYARRYQLGAALGLDTDEDDDGAEAEGSYGAASAKTVPPRDLTPKKVVGAKDPAIALKAAKDRVRTLVDKLSEGELVPTDAAELKKFYGDQVFSLTGLSLPLASTLEDFETIGQALADIAEKQK